ncbi:MAG: DMT family transporter [Acetobacterales bacterium]
MIDAATRLLRPPAWAAALPPNAQGMLLMIAAVSGFAGMTAALKYVSQELPFLVVILVRMAFGIVPLLPWIARNGIGTLRTHRFPLHVARALNGYLALACFVYALTQLSLADVTAIGFARPLWVIVIAALFLGETVGWRRGTATVVGFLGVLVILRPGGHLDPAMLVALLGSFGACMTLILIKMLSTTEPGGRIVFYHQGLSFLIGLAPAVWFWETPTPTQCVWIAVSAFCGTFGHLCFARACKLAEATVIAPMEYTRLVAATALGFALFGELPSIWVVPGTALIAGASLYIARREARLKAAGATGKAVL